jgi:hypothetical protein
VHAVVTDGKAFIGVRLDVKKNRQKNSRVHFDVLHVFFLEASFFGELALLVLSRWC